MFESSTTEAGLAVGCPSPVTPSVGYENPRASSWSAAGWAVPGVPIEPAELAAACPPVISPPVLSPVVQALLTAFEQVAGRVPADLPASVALADTAALLGLGERLRAFTLSHVADVDARHLHTADGSPSICSWMAARHSSLPPGELALARRLALMPCLDSAVQSGLLSVAVAAKLAGALVRAKRHLDRPVTVTLDALHGAPGSLAPIAGSGAIVPRSLVPAWWCDSNVTRFVLSLGHKVIHSSHTARTLTAHERRTKTVETGGYCQGAGCPHGPGHTLIPHHADPWATSHTTSLVDTVLFCEQTHHQLHTGHLIRLNDGRWLDQHGWQPPPGRP